MYPDPGPATRAAAAHAALTRGTHADVNNKPTYISRDGLDKLRLELDEMVNVRRPEVAQRIHDAKEHGDLTENAEYEDAKNEQAFVEGRIATLEALIKNAKGPKSRQVHQRREPTRTDYGCRLELRAIP